MSLLREYIRELVERATLHYPAKHLTSGAGEYSSAGWWRDFDPSSQEAKEWAKTVDFDEPIGVNVYLDGSVVFSDGHHRAMAGKILDRKVPIEIGMNKMDEHDPNLWPMWHSLIMQGHSPREINPEKWNLKSVEQLQSTMNEGVMTEANEACCLRCHFDYEEEHALPHLPDDLQAQLKKEHKKLEADGYPREAVLVHTEREMVWFKEHCPAHVVERVQQDHEKYKAGTLEEAFHGPTYSHG